MPIIDDFRGRPSTETESDDAFAVENDLLSMPSLPWRAIAATFFTVVLGFGIAHTIVIATKEKNKLIGQTLARQEATGNYAATAATSGVIPEDTDVVLIPAGPFTMGRDDGDEETNSDTTPSHVVDVPAFYIGTYEVTNQQYQTFVEDMGYIPPPHWKGQLTFPEGTGNLPVTYVNQENAQAYANWAGGRLCSEAEWEKAGRGEDGRLYPYGNEDDPERANIDYRADHLTSVGSYPQGVSPHGVHDMMGNVYEWTGSRYAPYPGNTDDIAYYSAFMTDADGNVMIDPDEESHYVITRGGCWKCDPWSSQVTTRNPTRPDFASDFFGIRVCWNAPSQMADRRNPE